MSSELLSLLGMHVIYYYYCGYIPLNSWLRGLHTVPLSVLITVCLGEFGVVYKAHLQWHRDGAAELVAVKTLKGLYSYNLFLY